jgi:hypothetical protein
MSRIPMHQLTVRIYKDSISLFVACQALGELAFSVGFFAGLGFRDSGSGANCGCDLPSVNHQGSHHSN